jgi:hypothetical protein
VKLRVTVRRANGGPAARADVLALDPLGQYLEPPGAVVRERKSADGDGRAAFEITGGTATLRVLAALEGESALSDGLDVSDGRDRDVTLDLTFGGTVVTCDTVDESDLAVARATVTLTAGAPTWPLVLTAESDEEGRVAFPAVQLEPNGWVQLDATAPGRTPAQVLDRPSKVADRPVRLVLPRAVTVRGRAVDGAGQPVAGARARIVGSAFHVTTAGDGRFALAALPPSGGALLVAKAGLAPALRPDLPGGGGDVDVGDVLLGTGGRVVGVVLDAEGKPVAGALATLALEGTDVVLHATADASGRFAFDGVADLDHVLTVQEPAAPRNWSTRRKTVLGEVRPDRGEIRTALDGRATVVLRFLNDADRTPVVVGSVKLAARAVGPTPADLAWAWSGANIDSVRFQPEHAGTFDLTIEIPGWEVGTAKAVEVLPDRETTIEVLFRRR